MKKLHNSILGILLLGIIFSCNQPKEKDLDGFLKAKIETIKKAESSTGLALRDQNDSIYFASLFNRDFRNYDNLISKIEINKTVEIKGIIYQFNDSKKYHKLFDQSNLNSSSSIILVKDINFIE